MAMSEIVRQVVEEEAKMDMTPMIDVVFLLLIFFMCTMRFKLLEGKLDSRLPKDIGQNSGGKPIDRDELRIRIQVIEAKPAKLRDMVIKRKSFEEVFGSDAELKEDTRFVMKISVGEAAILRMIQETTVQNKQPFTSIKFQNGAGTAELPDDSALLAKLQQAHKQFPEMPVIIDPDRCATYAALVVALDACTKVGFEEIKFSGKISDS